MGKKGFYPWIKSIFSGNRNSRRGPEGVYAGPEMIRKEIVQDVYAGPEPFDDQPADLPDSLSDSPADSREEEPQDPCVKAEQMPPIHPPVMLVYAGPEYFQNRSSMPAYAGPQFFNNPGQPGPGMSAPPEIRETDGVGDSEEVPEGYTACPCCGCHIMNKSKFCHECGTDNPGYESEGK